MTTSTTQLARYRSQLPFEPPSSVSQNTTFRELWTDGVATIAAVTLLSILVFEALRLLLP